MGTECGVLPYPFIRDAHSALVGFKGHCYEIEAVSVCLEWLVGEDLLHSRAGVFKENILFCSGITFSYDCYVNAFLRGAVLKQFETRSLAYRLAADENVLWIDFVSE